MSRLGWMRAVAALSWFTIAKKKFERKKKEKKKGCLCAEDRPWCWTKRNQVEIAMTERKRSSQGEDGKAVGFITVTLAARRSGPLIGTGGRYRASRGGNRTKKKTRASWFDGPSITVFLVGCSGSGARLSHRSFQFSPSMPGPGWQRRPPWVGSVPGLGADGPLILTGLAHSLSPSPLRLAPAVVQPEPFLGEGS